MVDVPRGDHKALVVFSSKELADAFVNKAPEAKALKMASAPFPRKFVGQFQKNGTFIILNPLTMAEGGDPVSVEAEATDNPELTSICQEDQADRAAGKAIDWKIVGPRDTKRLERVKALYFDGKIITGPDFFNAALVMQHGHVPEDYQLAHDFAIVAVSKGRGEQASWLAAASEDRFLMAIGWKQRFGTQLSGTIIVDGAVTDHLREELNVPPLAEEGERAKSLASAPSSSGTASSQPKDPAQ